MSNPKFHLFPNLPPELQIQIFTQAVEGLPPRDIEIWSVARMNIIRLSHQPYRRDVNPRSLMLPLLHTNKLARSIALKTYTLGFHAYLKEKIYVSAKDRIIVQGFTINIGNGSDPMFGLNLLIKAVRGHGEVDYERGVGIEEFQEVKQILGLRIYHRKEGTLLRDMVLLGP